LLILALCIGFFFPELWLSSRIKKRQAETLRDLPHVIDLLNICVGAGLDFMVAVNRVTQEFRSCVLVEELKVMVQEMQMGSSRREAMKNLSKRINSPEIISFVRTLLQADRMGTPISETLKMQSEEIRIRRFQKGEEAALKAPIKLLAPLLFFILPVVLFIVAGPIVIQFTRGGMIKF
jgi:tight adherence protein C